MKVSATILLTMVDRRTDFANDVIDELRDHYGGKVNVFRTEIPHSIRAAKAWMLPVSVFFSLINPARLLPLMVN